MMGPAIALQMLGLGGGPLLAAQLIEQGAYSLVVITCIDFVVLSYVWLTNPMLRHRALLTSISVQD
jgi:hypothetical protein